MKENMATISLVLITALVIWRIGFQEGRIEIGPQYTSEQAIDAIIGEASNQSFTAMKCIAHGIRNRGTLKGVYGFGAGHNKGETALTRINAQLAWEESEFEPDPVQGAKEWRGTGDLIPNEFLNEQMIECGDFIFLKPNKTGIK